LPVVNEPDKQAIKIVESLFTAESLEDGFDIVADDVVVLDWTMDSEVRGKSELMERIHVLDEALHDGNFDIKHMFACDGMVVVDAVYSAVFVSAYKGVAAHGQKVSWKMRDMFLVENNMVTRMWYASDTLEMAKALGAVDPALLKERFASDNNWSGD